MTASSAWLLDHLAVDGCITKAPGGGECAGPSPVDRRKQGMKRSVLVEGDGIPLGRVLAGAHRHDSPLLEPTLDLLAELGPLPEQVTVHLDAGYDSGKTRYPAGRPRPARRDRAQGREGADPGQPALARRAHQVRHEAPCCIPGAAGRDWREVPGSNG